MTNNYIKILLYILILLFSVFFILTKYNKCNTKTTLNFNRDIIQSKNIELKKPKQSFVKKIY